MGNTKMNKKAQQFMNYMQTNFNEGEFALKELQDARHTTLFYAYIKVGEDLSLKCLVLMDDTQNILLRVNLKEWAVCLPLDMDNLLSTINQLNCNYPLFKFYYDVATRTIALEMIYVAQDDRFEPKILQNYLAWIIRYIPDMLQRLN